MTPSAQSNELLGQNDAAFLNSLWLSMQKAAALMRLPFHRRNWTGLTGNWLGTGIGSSIDFQDHRPYLPGDDPRYIDWQAYARTGNYTMKLYREEVSPQVDLVLDCSPSMAAIEAKAKRALELFYFSIASASASSASLRIWIIHHEHVMRRTMDEILAHSWALPSPGSVARSGKLDAPSPDLHRIEWRSGSLRVFISDLLFPTDPPELLAPMTASKGFPVIFSPFSRDESDPTWDGNLRLVECETLFERNQRVDSTLVQDYCNAYRRHFSFWKEETRKRDGALARVPASGTFINALQVEAPTVGAVELCN